MKTIKTKESDAGVMVVKQDDTTTRYEITTLPWNYRGWKKYFTDKLVRILSGKTIITQEINGKDTEITLTPKSGDYIIPSWIPNIFYFPELTEMIEEFPNNTKTENFERYRAMKN